MEDENIKEEIEKDEEIEDQEETTSFDNLDEETFTYTVDNNNVGNGFKKTNTKLDKSYIYILIGVLILITIIILIVVVVNSTKKNSYSEIENKMVTAAKKYYNDNDNLLPISDGGHVKVDAETLIQNSFLKPFSELAKNENCTGYVEVYKTEEDYTYFPTLNCEGTYNSSKLIDKIKESGTVETGDGLYLVDNEYIFRGEFPNNNVKFDDKNWRIIKINSDNSIKMILTEKEAERNVWDDRYNSTVNSNSGINDFRVSRILEYLENAYNKNIYVSKKNKNLLVKGSWCIGKISQESTNISSLDICNDTYDNLYIGLLQVDEVLKASIDKNCINTDDGECTNYNYFLYIPSTWTINASSDKSYKAFSTSEGYINARDASNPNYVRPVINLNSNVLYKKGNGSSEDPYVIGN